MNQINQKIIDAVIQKAERQCPGSLAAIGVYGSAATGDIHAKSDLDLMILIDDPNGYQLADGFILDDSGIGYDIYCTPWEMLESDARCTHAQLSRLLDAQLVYVKDSAILQRLEAIRETTRSLLASDKRLDRAREALDRAKLYYADCFLTDSLPRIRTSACGVIACLLDCVMLFHGKYFQKGTKRAFEELASLELSFDLRPRILVVVCGETTETIRTGLTELMNAVQLHLQSPKAKEVPCRDNLSGTYEEMFSNWRNKMQEAADNQDPYSSFMNMAFCQFMLDEIAESICVSRLDVMAGFDPHRLNENAVYFDDILCRYLTEYRQAGIDAKHFPDIDAFLTAYLKQESLF